MFITHSGVLLNKITSGNYILILFSVLMIAVAGSMLRTKPHFSQQDRMHVPCKSYTLGDWLKMLVVGLTVGILTGFFGVGGGFLIVPALVLLGKFPTHQAIGTSLLIITMTSFSGFLGNLSLENINFSVAALFVIGGLFGVISGAKFSACISARKLNIAFAIFVILVAIYLLYVNLF